ncbi:MAG: AbrB/MazE/SpoVT family DNA-binding domain-containing protein [Burkholderiaceae bacterium]|jgi:antitoxin component of MazEF toxin-antitoxin module
MIKTIAKIGNSQGLIFDAALRELTGLQEGDEVNVTVHEGGSIVITPMRQTISAADAARAARDLIKRNADLFERLSK